MNLLMRHEKKAAGRFSSDGSLTCKTHVHAFSHPDYTVGSGISPDHAFRLAGFTAGRESNPALKITPLSYGGVQRLSREL